MAKLTLVSMSIGYNNTVAVSSAKKVIKGKKQPANIII